MGCLYISLRNVHIFLARAKIKVNTPGITIISSTHVMHNILFAFITLHNLFVVLVVFGLDPSLVTLSSENIGMAWLLFVILSCRGNVGILYAVSSSGSLLQNVETVL